MALGREAQLPERISEELLSCSICFGTYSLEDKQPKLLPCSHTFCLGCIGEYLKTAGRNSKSKGKFLCPACRTENLLPKNGIQDFPNNITVLGLLDLVRDSAGTKPLSPQAISYNNESAGRGHQSLYPSLPKDITPYVSPITGLAASDNAVEIPIIDADPDKCYECAKPKPSVTLKCGHSICKTCKRKRQIKKATQSMCPLCMDLQAAAMLLATEGSAVEREERRRGSGPVSMETSSPHGTPTTPSAPIQKLDSPMEADRPPSFNPEFESIAPSAPVLVLPGAAPTRVAPPPPKPQMMREASPIGKSGIRDGSPGGRNPPPPPPPRRLPGEILGSPLKCVKKIGSYSEVRMQTNAFKSPSKVSMYKNGNFLVVDQDMMTVQVFNSGGEYLSFIKAMGVQSACFYTPDRLAVATHRGIHVYSINGTPTGESAPAKVENVIPYKFGFIAITQKSLSIYSQNLSVYREIKKKIRPGVIKRSSAFESIKAVAVTTQNDIAVLDTAAGEIYLLDEDGNIKLTYSPMTETCGAMKDPYSITFDRYNNLYVSDTGNKRVLKFYANGKFARCVLDFTLGNPRQKDIKTSVYGVSSADEKHLVVALSGDKTAEVRLYEV